MEQIDKMKQWLGHQGWMGLVRELARSAAQPLPRGTESFDDNLRLCEAWEGLGEYRECSVFFFLKKCFYFENEPAENVC